jgi:hypothetical protein
MKTLRVVKRLATALLVVAASSAVSAEISGMGERAAKESMGLVAFLEMGNIGARDVECKGTPFPVADISSAIDGEIVPIIDAINRVDKTSDLAKRAETISLLNQLPSQKVGGVGVVQRIYDQKKQEARVAYGGSGACAALSSMVQTVIQQKRLALSDIAALVGVRKSK